MTDGTGDHAATTYDQLDRLTESKDGHGDVVKYEYDLANERTKITYPNSKSVTACLRQSRTTGKSHRLVDHSTKFTYNPDSEPGSHDVPDGNAKTKTNTPTTTRTR